MESTRDRLPYRPAPARGFALYIRQGEFPAGQPLGGRSLSPSLHARHFEHEDEHVHEHEE
jgi:hypothetical protein